MLNCMDGLHALLLPISSKGITSNIDVLDAFPFHEIDKMIWLEYISYESHYTIILGKYIMPYESRS